MKRLIFWLIIFIVFISQSLYGQVTLDSMAKEQVECSEKYPSELIYLQTSKDIYETGEDLWFKAYQLDAQSLNLSAGSRTLYLQVIQESDSSVVWQEKYPINDGVCDGHIYLDKDLVEGNYFIEAYTSNSFYDDKSGLSSVRKIKVVNNIANNTEVASSYQEVDTSPEAVTHNSEVESPKGFRFDTYPEGGKLINGNLSQLAFKATDGKGNPLDVSGELYENDQAILNFESSHDGMGKFRFTPLVDKNYEIRLSNGHTYPLSEIDKEGISLSLTNQNDSIIEFTVKQSPRLPNQSVYIFGHMRGVPYCGAEAKIQDSIKIRLPLKEFVGQGIAEFILLDSDMQPVAERLAFIRPDQKLYITATTDDKTYMVRNKVKLKLKVTDDKGLPAVANLGVSVFDGAYADQSYPVNIQTHALLSSQIKGNIHNPYYYFNEENKDRKDALDLLLMTQGWRKYTRSYGKNLQEGGKILNDDLIGIQTIKNKKLQGSEQMVQISGASGDASFVWVDSIGHFTVNQDMLNQFRGYIYLKPMLPKNYGPNLQLEDSFVEINKILKHKERYYPFIDSNRIKYDVIDRDPLINQFGTVLLDEVSVTGKTRRPFRDKMMGRLDSLAQADLGPWVCEHRYLENYKEGYTHHPYNNYEGEKFKPIDGETYRIVEYKLGENGIYYLVHFRNITYEGALYTDEELLKMNNMWRVKGYYAEREFYEPNDIEILSSLPDMRNTLMWAPSVITDEKGEATLTFRCSDINTLFVARIEGIGGQLLGVAECEFGVTRAGQKK